MDTDALTKKTADGYPGNGFCIIRIELDDAGKPTDWVYLYLNEALARMEGKTVDELLGHRFFEVFPERDRSRLLPHYEAACHGKSVSFDDISDEVDCFLHVDVYPTGEPNCCACVLRNLKESFLANKQKERKKDFDRLIGRLEEERHLNAQIKEFATTMGMVYPLAISMDYKGDSYQMIEYNNFLNKTASDSGSIDELIRVGASTVPDAEKAKEFWELFNRESVIEAFKQGKKQLFLRHPRLVMTAMYTKCIPWQFVRNFPMSK